jgi:hypothetical protein
MQSNFQQFVFSNKGNLITFKHQGATVSKYVVDVCGEYFTAKGRQTDVKIDGFYYFAECEMYNRSLIETLAYHKYVILIGEKSPMPDAFFEYQDCKVVNDTLMVNGKQLSAANPDVGYTASYIGEVWAIVEGKYTQVWKKTIDRLLINGDDLKKIGVKKEIGGPEDEIKKQKIQWYKENADDWFEFCGKNVTFKADKFMYVLGKIKREPYSEELYNELCSSYEGLRDYFIREFKNNRNKPRLQALVKRFLVLTNNFRKNFGNKERVHKLLDLINEEISIEGENWYERMFEKKENVTGSPVNIEHKGKAKTVEIINDNALINKKEYVLAKDCKDGTPMALLKKNVSGASGPVKYGDEDKPVNIEYRGKAKTVEIMNEYTHKNGKEYVWVKDLTDNGKTKTLFKEYIKYM